MDVDKLKLRLDRRVFVARPELGRERSLPIEEIDAIFITSIEELPHDEGHGDAGSAAA